MIEFRRGKHRRQCAYPDVLKHVRTVLHGPLPEALLRVAGAAMHHPVGLLIHSLRHQLSTCTPHEVNHFWCPYYEREQEARPLVALLVGQLFVSFGQDLLVDNRSRVVDVRAHEFTLERHIGH